MWSDYTPTPPPFHLDYDICSRQIVFVGDLGHRNVNVSATCREGLLHAIKRRTNVLGVAPWRPGPWAAGPSDSPTGNQSVDHLLPDIDSYCRPVICTWTFVAAC